MVLGEASLLLGVCVQTLRRWDESGRLVAKRTFGNHRRYNLNDILKIYNQTNTNNTNITIGYARVSTHDQKQDLTHIKNRYWKNIVLKIITNIKL